MKKSNILAILLALILVFSFAACGGGGGSSSPAASGGGAATAMPGSFEVGGDTVNEEVAGASEYDPTYTVNLKVVGAEDNVLYSGTVTLKSPTMWANEFLRAAITDKGLAQSGIEVGFVDTIGDYVNNSTDGIYWMYSVNGVSPMVGSNQYQLRDGDYMLWAYAAYE
jgi:uncharacterized lipoprotein YehR (DUF1307 family)